MSWECISLLVVSLVGSNVLTGLITWSRCAKRYHEERSFPPKLKQYPPEGRPVEGSIWHDEIGQTYILAGDDWELLR